MVTFGSWHLAFGCFISVHGITRLDIRHEKSLRHFGSTQDETFSRPNENTRKKESIKLRASVEGGAGEGAFLFHLFSTFRTYF